MTNAYLVRGVVMHRRLRPVRRTVSSIRCSPYACACPALDDTGNVWFEAWDAAG